MTTEFGRAHWDAYYEYSESEYARFAKRYRFNYGHLLPADRNARILDVGCAGGLFLNFLKTVGFRRLSGIDPNPKAIAVCRASVTEGAQVADAREYLRAHTGEFDLVVCNHVIEHFPTAEGIEMCRAMHGALAPGGRVIITVPNGMTPWSGYHLYHDLTHDHLFTAESLVEVLAVAGFHDIRAYPEGPVPYDLLTTIRYGLWKIREAWLKLAFAIDVGVGRAVRAQVIVTQGLIATGRRQD